jgi:uncharacterized protein YaaN involved in tellurite resistance
MPRVSTLFNQLKKDPHDSTEEVFITKVITQSKSSLDSTQIVKIPRNYIFPSNHSSNNAYGVEILIKDIKKQLENSQLGFKEDLQRIEDLYKSILQKTQWLDTYFEIAEDLGKCSQEENSLAPLVEKWKPKEESIKNYDSEVDKLKKELNTLSKRINVREAFLDRMRGLHICMISVNQKKFILIISCI